MHRGNAALPLVHEEPEQPVELLRGKVQQGTKQAAEQGQGLFQRLSNPKITRKGHPGKAITWNTAKDLRKQKTAQCKV